jgi:hypothetical protein
MILNTENFKRVKALLKVPYYSVSYCGCESENLIYFQLANYDKYGDICAGVILGITQDFKIVKKQRIKVLRYCEKRSKYNWFYLPLIYIATCKQL